MLANAGVLVPAPVWYQVHRSSDTGPTQTEAGDDRHSVSVPSLYIQVLVRADWILFRELDVSRDYDDWLTAENEPSRSMGKGIVTRGIVE